MCNLKPTLRPANAVFGLSKGQFWFIYYWIQHKHNGMKFCLKLQSYFNLVIFLTDHVANISWKRNYNKNASLDFFHPMVFLIDEKLGNLALFDEISLLGITGKQKSQCTPLLQSNQCAIYNNALLLWHCGQFSVIWFIKVVVLCASEASLGLEQKEINVILPVSASNGPPSHTIHVPRSN